EPRLVGAVEKSRQGIILLLRNRIVFVVVAPRTPRRQREEALSDNIGAVERVFDSVFFVNRAVFSGALPHPQKGRREFLLFSGVRQQIARQLPLRELIERHVAVESADDPVTI